MKKIFTYMLAGLSLLLFSRCDALDIDPTSSIADSNYWKTEAQFSTFNVGLHALLRECSFNFFLLGEPRADIYGDVPFGGEATQGMERLPFNTINKENTGISNFAGMYKVINQINLMIAKTKETTVLSEAGKNYYLGEAYGMRAYLYFHLLRSWGDVILYLDYTNGASLDLSNLSKAASPAEEVMKQIKEDITASEKGFGSDYSFKYGRYYWSMAATQMLKGEVYLWSGRQWVAVQPTILQPKLLCNQSSAMQMLVCKMISQKYLLITIKTTLKSFSQYATLKTSIICGTIDSDRT